MKVMSVRISEETYSRLEKRADRLGIPPAVLARAYLKESVEDREDLSAEIRSAEAATAQPRGKKKRKRGR